MARMNVEVRLARPATDATGVAAIYRAAVETSAASFETSAPDPREMADRMCRGLTRAPWLVAVSDAEVVAFAYAAPHRDRPAYRWSVDLSAYARESHRGRGIGRSLYDRLLPLLERQGFANAYAGITLPNPASVFLHEGIGMKLIGVYERVGWKHGAWHDVAWYGMRLAEPPVDRGGRPIEPRPVNG